MGADEREQLADKPGVGALPHRPLVEAKRLGPVRSVEACKTREVGVGGVEVGAHDVHVRRARVVGGWFVGRDRGCARRLRRPHERDARTRQRHLPSPHRRQAERAQAVVDQRRRATTQDQHRAPPRLPVGRGGVSPVARGAARGEGTVGVVGLVHLGQQRDVGRPPALCELPAEREQVAVAVAVRDLTGRDDLRCLAAVSDVGRDVQQQPGVRPVRFGEGGFDRFPPVGEVAEDGGVLAHLTLERVGASATHPGEHLAEGRHQRAPFDGGLSGHVTVPGCHCGEGVADEIVHEHRTFGHPHFRAAAFVERQPACALPGGTYVVAPCSPVAAVVGNPQAPRRGGAMAVCGDPRAATSCGRAPATSRPSAAGEWLGEVEVRLRPRWGVLMQQEPPLVGERAGRLPGLRGGDGHLYAPRRGVDFAFVGNAEWAAQAHEVRGALDPHAHHAGDRCDGLELAHHRFRRRGRAKDRGGEEAEACGRCGGEGRGGCDGEARSKRDGEHGS